MSEGNGKQPPATGDKVLTNRQGHPVYDNQNQRTVGERGPATMENYQFFEKMAHFDRERVPERVVHARGATAFGYFEATGKVGDEPISTYTRAKLFQEPGKRTEMALRFSTVAGGRDSSEAIRDPRGFAVKFYTEDGNWDLVGNNLGVFFIRDAIKFPDFIHSQKPDPVTFERQVPNRVFDFASQTPESLHMFMLILSPRGVPASYRNMQGFGVNTYKWVNAAGETKLVKYHWHPKQGVKSWTEADAAAMQAEELGCHTKDLYEAIERGEYPGVGAQRPDDGRPRPPRARLGSARRHEDLARRQVPAASCWRDDAQSQRRRSSQRERADRDGHRRSRGWPRLLG
jgi:catalase